MPSTLGRIFYPGFLLNLTASQQVPTRCAERFAICLFVHGNASINHADGPKLVAAPAALLLDERTRPVMVTSNDFECYTIYFHPNVVNDRFEIDTLRYRREVYTATTDQDVYLLEPFIVDPSACAIIALTTNLAARLRASCDALLSLLAAQPHDRWPCLSRSYLIEILFTLRLQQQNVLDRCKTALQDAQPRLEHAFLQLQERYNQPFTLNEFAHSSGTNRTTLNAYFRKRTGLSVRAYIIQLRMTMAASLLRDTLLPVSEIMHRIGYENPSHFTRAFRSATGRTPSAYRESTCWILAHYKE